MDSKDKTHLCVICCKPFGWLKIRENISSQQRFLLLLTRYLRMDWNTSKEMELSKLVICEDCSFLGSSFCNLYFQLECIKLELNWKVRKICETMVSAERVSSRSKAFRAQYIMLNSSRKYKNMEAFRKETIKTCKRKLQLSQPHLVLKRIKLNEPSMAVKQESISPGSETYPSKCIIKSEFSLEHMMSFLAVLNLSSIISAVIPPSPNVNELDILREVEVENSQILGDDNYDVEENQLVIPTLPHNLMEQDETDDIYELEQPEQRPIQPEKSPQPVQLPRKKQRKHLGGHLIRPHQSCREVMDRDSRLHPQLESYSNWSEWNCINCSESFSEAHQLAWHEISGHNRNFDPSKNSLQCSRCNLICKNKLSIVNHFVSRHLNIPVLNSEAAVCPICKIVLPTKYTLAGQLMMEQHIKNWHHVEGMDSSDVATCEVCRAPFTSRFLLDGHLRTVHKRNNMD